MPVALDAGQYNVDESGGALWLRQEPLFSLYRHHRPGRVENLHHYLHDVARVGGTPFLTSSGSSSRNIVLFAGGATAVLAIAVTSDWYARKW